MSPLFLVPSSSSTGAATSNMVILRTGVEGELVPLPSPNLIPTATIIDSDLTNTIGVSSTACRYLFC
jgi:alcohol dehydrogenase class IV